MEYEVRAKGEGKVEKVFVSVGEMVDGEIY